MTHAYSTRFFASSTLRSMTTSQLECPLPEFEEMLKRGVEAGTHICRVHRVHIAETGKIHPLTP